MPETSTSETNVTNQPKKIGNSTLLSEQAVKPQKETPAVKLKKDLEIQDVESRVIQIPNSETLNEAVILIRDEAPTEKMIRVYRGVNQIDASSIFNQVPYAMRTVDKNGKAMILEDARQEVELLAEQPTYKHLASYVDKVRPYLNESQLKRLEYDLEKIEDGILNGRSLRKELIYNQIGHAGGVIDGGISPYLSASHDPKEAFGYTMSGGALLVIDLPISKIEDFGPDSTEMNIKGVLNPEYITAVILRSSKDVDDQDIQLAMSAISETVKISIYDKTEAERFRRGQIEINDEKDKQQWKKDVEDIREKRTRDLVKQFPELNLDTQELHKKGIDDGSDIYSKTTKYIFDYYADRFKNIGQRERNIGDYEYSSDKSYGERKPYDRDNITNEMLDKLRKFVLYHEDRDKQRSRR